MTVLGHGHGLVAMPTPHRGRGSCPFEGHGDTSGLAKASVYLDRNDELARADLPSDAG